MFPPRNVNNPLDRFHDTPLQRGTAPLRIDLCGNKQNKNNVKSLYFSLFCEAVMTVYLCYSEYICQAPRLYIQGMCGGKDDTVSPPCISQDHS